MAKSQQNAKSIIRGFSQLLGIFSQYEKLISLECAVESERNGVIDSVVSCLVVELFVHESHQKVFHQPAIKGLKVL